MSTETEIKEKILNGEQVRQRIAEWRRGGESIILANGGFDLLHVGHVRYLRGAKQVAPNSRLIVAINSDESARLLKGAGRPRIPQGERAEMVAALADVDAVVIFDELTPREVISQLLPDVLVKGGDWPGDQIVGREEVEAAGGRVVSIPLIPGYSTTAILKKIRESCEPSRVNEKSQTEEKRASRADS